MFRIVKTNPNPQLGEEVSFQCILPIASETKKDRCEFEAPNGQIFAPNGTVEFLQLQPRKQKTVEHQRNRNREIGE
jgi:hypothetical protein